MDIIIIAAISDNMALGIKGGLPWDMPADRAFLLEKIEGKFQIMGRRSYEEIVETDFFTASFHAVLTRNTSLKVKDGQTFPSFQAALDLAIQRGEDQVIVLGGGQVYKQTINLATELILTEIHTEVEADTFFPPVNPEIWQEVKRESYKADAENAFDYDFVWYQKKDA